MLGLNRDGRQILKESRLRSHQNRTANTNESKADILFQVVKYFYEFKPLCSLAEIIADILALETSSLELEKAVLEE